MKIKVASNQSLSDQRLISSIHELFRSDERLLYFLFHHQMPQLRLSPIDLLKESQDLARGEKILIQIALDLWSGTGDVHLPRIIEGLDNENFIAFIRAILRLREIDLQLLNLSGSKCCN